MTLLSHTEQDKASSPWALALSTEGDHLAASTANGHINVWSLPAPTATPAPSPEKIHSFETKGSFGLCIALSPSGTHTASGHASGAIYLFANATGRLSHSLPGLIKPVRAVAFSPASTLLAAAGDSRVIAVYHVESGEQVAVLKGHAAWVMTLDFSFTGEWLLSGGWDGKVKVWSVERGECVATHAEMEGKSVWSALWLPKTGRVEEFASAGAGRAISFYREAAGS